MCRAKLPPGPETVYDEACTLGLRAERAVNQAVKERLRQRAAELCGAAAAQGCAKAQYSLAHCYYDDEGVAKDEQRAAELWGAAAAQGCADAQYMLAHPYCGGGGVAKDEQRAVELWGCCGSR